MDEKLKQLLAEIAASLAEAAQLSAIYADMIEEIEERLDDDNYPE